MQKNYKKICIYQNKVVILHRLSKKEGRKHQKKPKKLHQNENEQNKHLRPNHK